MKILITALSVAVVTMQVHADEFHLTDASGKLHGPFEFKQGALLAIAGQEYTISKILTKDQKIVERMQSIIIPEISFRHAHISDIIDYLREASFDFDRKSEPRHRGVNFVLNLGTPTVAPSPPTEHPFAADPFAGAPKAQSRPTGLPPITVSARGLSLFYTLNVICEVSNLQWAVQNAVVMIEPKKLAEAGR